MDYGKFGEAAVANKLEAQAEAQAPMPAPMASAPVLQTGGTK
ncbi:hypothetical protein [Archangium sp.]